MAGKKGAPVLVRFWAKVNRRGDDECWPWTAAKSAFGQGVFVRAHDRRYQAYRFMWMLAHGPIPDGLEVCHRCDNPTCVNPSHLFLGTHADNLKDAGLKGRMPRGEGHHAATLTTDDVIAIRQLGREGMPPASIAARFGTSRRNVRFILARQRWAHVTEAA